MSWPKFDSDHLLITAGEMANIEEQVILNGFPVEALMEKVGIKMSRWLIGQPGLLDKGAVDLVGPGHNGGDGLVVARELHLAGIKVSVWCPFSIKKALTANHFSHVKWLGVEQLEHPPEVLSNSLWIDALFGLAQSRKVPELVANLLEQRQQYQPGRLLSLDVPSGV